MIAIVGATASGKSAVAMDVARAVDGVEIVSIDSMQVYRGLDIGTAKPTAAERAEVPHHLLDLVEPDEDFSVADLQRVARAAVADICGRGRHPLLVGGTGLYLRAVVDDLDVPGRHPDVLASLDAEPDTDALHERLRTLDPIAADRIPPGNRRRVLRALEVTIGSGRPFSSYGPGLTTYPPTDVVQVGIDVPLDELDERIERRVQQMLDAGLLDEVRRLQGRARSRTAAVALGYRELGQHLAGERTLDDAVAEVVQRTRQLARRQLRWFRRDPRIRWVTRGEASVIVTSLVTGRGVR